MMRIIPLCLLLLYYWYFYASGFKRLEKPTSVEPSQTPPPHSVQFASNHPGHFRFVVDGKQVWEHTLPANTFKFDKDKIVALDPCHGSRDGKLLPAKGRVLYEYLKLKNPEDNPLKFKERGEFAVQHGDVYHFKCLQGRVDRLGMCPSGTTLVAGACQPINSCTDKPDGSILPHSILTQYVVCHGGKQIIKKCPDKQIFHGDRCEDMKELTHYCKMFPDEPFILDSTTRVECENGKPTFTLCKPGTMFFDRDFCEPVSCHGAKDGDKVPLPRQTANPFHFAPGYMTCRNGKIDEIVKCPQNWDLVSKDNLFFLPMVFDGEKCSVPSFCENVFSDDPDVIVPLHVYSEHLKNWHYSPILDRSAGHQCVNLKRKYKTLAPGKIVSKRFKAEKACEPHMPRRLPLLTDSVRYYDCDSETVVACPPHDSYFNGIECVPFPEGAIEVDGIPIYKFESLNREEWITAWDYSKDGSVQCTEPETERNSLYNICSHPDCSDYAFLSMIPDVAMLLPRDQRAKCKFYEGEKKLKKEPVDFDYHFWTQRPISDNGPREPEACTPGQKIQTGNFIWDSTLYATCNMEQPFVFCPSPFTQRIIPVDAYHACEPPKSKDYVYKGTDWHPFEINEIKRITPVDPDRPPQVKRKKGTRYVTVPGSGLDVPHKQRFNLLTDGPVKLEVRYRVTHPPNVTFKYEDEQEEPTTLTSTLNHGFLSKTESFTDKPLNFPKYKPVTLIFPSTTSLYT